MDKIFKDTREPREVLDLADLHRHRDHFKEQCPTCTAFAIATHALPVIEDGIDQFQAKEGLVYVHLAALCIARVLEQADEPRSDLFEDIGVHILRLMEFEDAPGAHSETTAPH